LVATWVGGLRGFGFCTGAATCVVGSTFSPGCCGWAVGVAVCAGAGVALLCGVGEGSAVGEACGCGEAAPGGGVVPACCASIGAVDAASTTSDDTDNSSMRLRWNVERKDITKFRTNDEQKSAPPLAAWPSTQCQSGKDQRRQEIGGARDLNEALGCSAKASVGAAARSTNR